MKYDKMYYTVFNAVTDALEIIRELPESPEKEKLILILTQCQKTGEGIYLAGGKA